MKNLTALLFIAFSVLIPGQSQTSGTLDFSVTTLPNGKKYSPKHVLAIWVEDKNGNFIKTLKLKAADKEKYLYTWNSKSSGNTTDAVTGSTLRTHTAHRDTWNCTNTSGALVADGNYSVIVEYTSEHKQGPITKVDFTKSETEFTFQPGNETYFTDIDLLFNPVVSTSLKEKEISIQLNTYPNPTSDILNIEMNIPFQAKASIKVYQANTTLIDIIWDGDLKAGEHAFSWDTRSLNGAKVAPGTYFVVVSGTNMFSTRQIVIH